MNHTSVTKLAVAFAVLGSLLPATAIADVPPPPPPGPSDPPASSPAPATVSVKIRPHRPTAGTRAVVTLVLPPGAHTSSRGHAACSAFAGGRRLATRAAVRASAVVCTFTLPRASAGKVLRGRISFIADGVDLRRQFRARIVGRS